VGVEPQAEDAVGNMIERGMAYNRGLAEGIRRCREAVEKIDWFNHKDDEGNFLDRNDVLAAIDAVKGE
jgi:hypothetical protein